MRPMLPMLHHPHPASCPSSPVLGADGTPEASARPGSPRRGTNAPWLLSALAGVVLAGAAPSSAGEWMVFLLFGQSNMAGFPKPEASDKISHPRINVLAYDNCPGLGRTYNTWYPATPPMHECYNGVGPGDAFARMMADSLPGDTIALVPCAISGVDIDFFRKGVVSARRTEFKIPPDDHWTGAYPWMIERAKLAQRKGRIAGILFHQGESDAGSPQWLSKVSEIVKDLKQDLGTGDIPFLAGELPHNGLCAGHNRLVAQIPENVPMSKVISASGLSNLSDRLHFDLPSQRILGKRYATAMLQSLPNPVSVFEMPVVPSPRIAIRSTPQGLEASFPDGTTRVEIIDLRGRVQALGNGTRFLLTPDRFSPGVHVLRARTPEGDLVGTVLLP